MIILKIRAPYLHKDHSGKLTVTRKSNVFTRSSTLTGVSRFESNFSILRRLIRRSIQVVRVLSEKESSEAGAHHVSIARCYCCVFKKYI